jgi:hypothetical protein
MRRRRFYRRQLAAPLLVVAVAAMFLVVPTVAAVPAQLVEGCATWIVAGAGLELLSALGFVVLFKLVFAATLSWRRTTRSALRALGASTILPAGGLVGPTVGAWSTGTEKPSLPQLARSTITFVALTNAPGAVVLTTFGTLLWLGFPSGPHQATLTILPALIAAGLLGLTWHLGRTSGGPSCSTAPTEVLADADKAHHGGKREHHRNARPGYRGRLEARRCARVLRLR